jgi:hypothetical protein
MRPEITTLSDEATPGADRLQKRKGRPMNRAKIPIRNGLRALALHFLRAKAGAVARTKVAPGAAGRKRFLEVAR